MDGDVSKVRQLVDPAVRGPVVHGKHRDAIRDGTDTLRIRRPDGHWFAGLLDDGHTAVAVFFGAWKRLGPSPSLWMAICSLPRWFHRDPH